MSLERRLEALEACMQGDRGSYKVPRALERYFHALDNARRELDGLEPLPGLEYTEEDLQDDLKTLDEHIPAMRADSGWQTEESRAFLDQWERDVTERVERYEND